MFPNKVTKPLFDKINIRGHGFSKTKLLIKKNETHFNSEQPLKKKTKGYFPSYYFTFQDNHLKIRRGQLYTTPLIYRIMV
jgi:hypothetical protein